jgi:hypothetical protein
VDERRKSYPNQSQGIVSILILLSKWLGNLNFSTSSMFFCFCLFIV